MKKEEEKRRKADRLMCCFVAYNVGGIFSTVLYPFANKILLAKFNFTCFDSKTVLYRLDHNKLFQCLKIRLRYVREGQLV